MSVGESLPKSEPWEEQANFHSPLKVSPLVRHDFLDSVAYLYASESIARR